MDFSGVKYWVSMHDHDMRFTFIYMFLTVIVALFIGPFWFLLMIFGHYSLDIIKYSFHVPLPQAVLKAARECKVDLLVVFIMVALIFVSGFVFGVAGLRQLYLGRFARSAGGGAQGAIEAGHAIRAAKIIEIGTIESSLGHRFMVALRGFHTFLAGSHSSDTVVGFVKKRGAVEIPEFVESVPLSRLEKGFIVVALFCVAIVVLQPLFLGYPFSWSVDKIIHELGPTYTFHSPW